jgi:hypothetical protein
MQTGHETSPKRPRSGVSHSHRANSQEAQDTIRTWDVQGSSAQLQGSHPVLFAFFFFSYSFVLMDLAGMPSYLN